MKEKIKQYWQQACSDWNYLFKLELKNIVKDEGVLIFFFLVPLAYPLLYSFIYTDEVVREVPIAVVDESHTTMSREYLRHVDASPDVKIINYCADMAEAERCIKKTRSLRHRARPCRFLQAPVERRTSGSGRLQRHERHALLQKHSHDKHQRVARHECPHKSGTRWKHH